MKMHKFEVYVIDHDDAGVDDFITEIENNGHYVFTVMHHQTADIGEWGEDHVLNYYKTPVEVYREYFEKDEE